MAAAATINSYADLLKLLLALGANLPAVWAKVQVLIQTIQEIIAILKPSTVPDSGTLQLVNVTAEEAEMEAQIGSAIVGEGSAALFDGALLRKAFAFAREHPELLSLLLSLLKG